MPRSAAGLGVRLGGGQPERRRSGHRRRRHVGRPRRERARTVVARRVRSGRRRARLALVRLHRLHPALRDAGVSPGARQRRRQVPRDRQRRRGRRPGRGAAHRRHLGRRSAHQPAGDTGRRRGRRPGRPWPPTRASRRRPAAISQLRAGEVDERLTTVLATLAGAHRLEIGAFVAMPGEDVAGAPLRTVELASIDGRPIAAGDPAVVEVVAFLGQPALGVPAAPGQPGRSQQRRTTPAHHVPHRTGGLTMIDVRSNRVGHGSRRLTVLVGAIASVAGALAVAGQPASAGAATDVQLRAAHFSPDTPPMDVYATGFDGKEQLVLPKLGYGQVSEYLPLGGGLYALDAARRVAGHRRGGAAGLGRPGRQHVVHVRRLRPSGGAEHRPADGRPLRSAARPGTGAPDPGRDRRRCGRRQHRGRPAAGPGRRPGKRRQLRRGARRRLGGHGRGGFGGSGRREPHRRARRRELPGGARRQRHRATSRSSASTTPPVPRRAPASHRPEASIPAAVGWPARSRGRPTLRAPAAHWWPRRQGCWRSCSPSGRRAC